MSRPSLLKKIGFTICFFYLIGAHQAQAFSLWPHKWFAKKPIHIIVAQPFINMRTGPGRGYPVFHVAEKNEKVRILKSRTDWFKVRTLSGEEGWVHREEINGSPTNDNGVLAFDPPGWEEYVNRGWEFGIFLGDFSGAEAFTAMVGYHFTPTLGAEVKVTNSFGDFSNTQLIGANLIATPFDNWKLSPFFTLGTGVLKVEPDTNLVQSDDREEQVLSVGGGFNYYFSRRFILRIEYNNHTVLTNRENNEEVNEWKTGISVFF